MAEFKIDGRMKVKTLKENFFNEFGGVLRVYNGKSEADGDALLSAIRSNDAAKGGELKCRASRTVGKFEQEMWDVFGIKVQVATKDDWVLVLDGITLSKIKDIPKNATRKDMEKFISYKREETDDEDSTAHPGNDDNVLSEDDCNNNDTWQIEDHNYHFEKFTEDELDKYKDLFNNYCEYDGYEILTIRNGDAYAELVKGSSGELYMKEMDGEEPYRSYYSFRNREQVVWVEESWLRIKDVEHLEQLASDVLEGDYISPENYVCDIPHNNDTWQEEGADQFFEDFTEDELDEYNDLFDNCCKYDEYDQVLIVENEYAYAKLAKGPSGDLYMLDMDGDVPYSPVYSYNRKKVIAASESWCRINDVEEFASAVKEGDYIHTGEY